MGDIIEEEKGAYIVHCTFFIPSSLPIYIRNLQRKGVSCRMYEHDDDKTRGEGRKCQSPKFYSLTISFHQIDLVYQLGSGNEEIWYIYYLCIMYLIFVIEWTCRLIPRYSIWCKKYTFTHNSMSASVPFTLLCTASPGYCLFTYNIWPWRLKRALELKYNTSSCNIFVIHTHENLNMHSIHF